MKALQLVFTNPFWSVYWAKASSLDSSTHPCFTKCLGLFLTFLFRFLVFSVWLTPCSWTCSHWHPTLSLSGKSYWIMLLSSADAKKKFHLGLWVTSCSLSGEVFSITLILLFSYHLGLWPSNSTLLDTPVFLYKACRLSDCWSIELRSHLGPFLNCNHVITFACLAVLKQCRHFLT